MYNAMTTVASAAVLVKPFPAYAMKGKLVWQTIK